MTTQSDPSDCGSALTALDSRSRANTRFGFSTSPVLAGRMTERRNVGAFWAVACPHSLALPRVVSTKSGFSEGDTHGGSPNEF